MVNTVPYSKDEGIALSIKDLSNPPSLTLNQRVVGSTPTRPTKTNNYLGRDTGSHFLESAGRCYYDVLENVSYLVRNLQERPIRRGCTEPTPCLVVKNTSFVYSACRCHDSHSMPTRGGVPIRARRTSSMMRRKVIS